ncbi:MAG: hypothetical protein HKN20_07575 [Gemmatimonadetes bacterium]|nr:hypothetical protein [Gemmatimonadota bacterium]
MPEARKKPRTVLVLDGETRKALAVVRSLGRQGTRLIVVSHRESAIACKSRYAARAVRCPSPKAEPAAFQTWLLSFVRDARPDMLLPLTDRSVTQVLALEETLRPLTILPFVSNETFRAVADKGELVRTAQTLGIDTPHTAEVRGAKPPSPEDTEIVKTFRYPAVLKPRLSESQQGDRFQKVAVDYLRGPIQALATLSRNPEVAFLLQEKIAGDGVGVFALCHRGEALSLFCHRRRLEKPPSGGVSVLCESLPVDEAPVEDTLRLLEHYRWDGVAMVEYKRAEDGRFVLMEINPRFWGSLQLAIDCGIDFPRLLERLYEDGLEPGDEKLNAARTPVGRYPAGRRLRWFLGTVDHFLIRLKREPAGALIDTVFRNRLYLLARPTRTRWQVFRWDDPGPFFFEVGKWFTDVYYSLRKKAGA